MRKRVAVLALCVAALGGCASSFDRPTEGWNKIKPPQNVEATVKEYFERILKDPESARYRFGKPVKAYANAGLIYGGKVAWQGYLVDVEVNAKNSLGGYTGFEPYMVFFSGDYIVKHERGRTGVLVTRVAD